MGCVCAAVPGLNIVQNNRRREKKNDNFDSTWRGGIVVLNKGAQQGQSGENKSRVEIQKALS